jgi:hypothetical protein
MKLGNAGSITLVNGDLHIEMDVVVNGQTVAPVSADVQVAQVLQLLQAGATNSMVKVALSLVISMIGGIVVNATEPLFADHKGE